MSVSIRNELLQEQRDANNPTLTQLKERIVKLEAAVARDDRILNALLHDSWDRECKYEIIPGELLADGSVRESLIQHCD
jgi:hypothetical protein